jgi:methionine salvage enolase-phosphatase E1
MCDQRGLNSCSTAMRKANGTTTTVYIFLDSLFPKAETNVRKFLLRQNNQDVNYSSIQISRWGVFLEEVPHSRIYS